MNFERGFGNRVRVEIAGNEGDFLTAKPPTPKPCIDSSRNWLGCNPTRQANCPFFANGRKIVGCATYSKLEYDPAYKPLRIARNLPPIDPAELDGFTIEEAS